MKTKILVLLIVFGLLASAMTVNAGNIGEAVTDIVTTLEAALIGINIISPPDDAARYGRTNVDVEYTTTNVSGSATKTYSLNGAPAAPVLSNPFTVAGIDNGEDGGTLNNVSINIEDPTNGSATAIRYFKVDITAPGQITTIVRAVGINYINWTWNNPSNTDFNNTIVNVTNATGTVVPDTKLPKDINYYNATGLAPNTPYTISVKTEDDAPAP